MDPVIVASNLKRSVYFIAAGEYFGKGFRAWFYQRFFHMIPVYRPSTRPEDVYKNADMFKACHEHLRAHRTLLIFPEGVSKTEKILKPLKTGVSRIAKGAILSSETPLKVWILPVGLNYSNPHSFRSDLFVKIGEPLLANDFIDFNNSEDTEDIRILTDKVEESLKRCLVPVEETAEEELLEKLMKIYAPVIRKERHFKRGEQNREFTLQNNIVKAMHFFKDRTPELYNEVADKIDRYLLKLKRHNLSSLRTKRSDTLRGIFIGTQFIVGFPIYVLAFIIHILPYLLIDLLNNKLKINETFKGSIILLTGLFAYLLWYTAATITLYVSTPLDWYSLLFPLLAYPIGIYGLIYLAAYKNQQARKRVRMIAEDNEVLFQELEGEQEEIITDLNTLRREYEKFNPIE